MTDGIVCFLSCPFFLHFFKTDIGNILLLASLIIACSAATFAQPVATTDDLTAPSPNRMESHSEAGKIHCTNEVFEALKEKFTFEERGEIQVKGKGVMRTWFLTGALE